MAEYSTTFPTDPKDGGGRFGTMTLGHAAKLAEDPETKALLMQLARRVRMAEPEMSRFREWATRADDMYFTENVTQGGADLWWNHPSATLPGRAHVSVNTSTVYVDTPAALQAVEPIENMIATDTTPEARAAASALERVYVAWKAEDDFELKWHKAATVKALYGRTAARVYWKEVKGGSSRPCVEVIDQPRNLYLGYKTDAFDELEWAAYCMRMDPNAVVEAYGVNITPMHEASTGRALPYVSEREDPYATDYSPRSSWLDMSGAQVEVWDYWYRMPVWKRGKYAGMATYNVVVCGNLVLRKPTKYPEYDGRLPYVPIFNTFIPGVPNGLPELYFAEQLIREKQEKITAGSQMISNAVAGDAWQLVGPDAPMRVPSGLKPKRNELIGPGPGNRIEVIAPFIAQFQLEQFIGRLDRELAFITGLNDVLAGLAPVQALNSSKAVNAMIANYEARLSMRRKLFYKWRRDIWSLALAVWAHEDRTIRDIVSAGGGTLDITDPSLSPRDDMETAQRALNLVSGKLWSQARAMDVVGVDDPETEQDLIREESTDAALWPERVQVMAQLMGALQALGLQAPPGAQEQAQGQMASSQETLRAALQGGTPGGTVATQGDEVQGMTPPIPGAPPEAGGAPFAAAQEPALMQSMVQGGQVKGRILTQQKLTRR